MKNRLTKFLVLLFSIAGVSAYVWHAAQRENQPSPPPIAENEQSQEPLMLSGSKSAAILDSEETKVLLGNQPVQSTKSEPVEKPRVTDEEVKEVRDNMLRSSKSGMVMSEEDVRKMLEKRAESPQNPPGAEVLVPSSKSMRIASPEEVKELAEKVKQWDQQQHKDQQQEQK